MPRPLLVSARAHDCVVLSSFSVLQVASRKGTFKSIAVPSRLYASPSKEKPLAGARISIKDNYDLEGIRTTMMNRAYNELYPPRTSSADFVTKLTQLGAIIVGKTKMSAFASAEEPTDQWIDYHCPFNPRGDTYQTPSCSSTGAGASLAGYPWLDHSVGSDSTFPLILLCPFYSTASQSIWKYSSPRGLQRSIWAQDLVRCCLEARHRTKL